MSSPCLQSNWSSGRSNREGKHFARFFTSPLMRGWCGHKWVSPELWLRLHGQIYFDCKSILIIKCRLTDWVSRARERVPGMFRNYVRGLSRELWLARCVVPRVNVSDNLWCVCAHALFLDLFIFLPLCGSGSVVAHSQTAPILQLTHALIYFINVRGPASHFHISLFSDVVWIN